MLCNMYTYSYLSGAVNRFAGIYPLPTTSYHLTVQLPFARRMFFTSWASCTIRYGNF